VERAWATPAAKFVVHLSANFSQSVWRRCSSQELSPLAKTNYSEIDLGGKENSYANGWKNRPRHRREYRGGFDKRKDADGRTLRWAYVPILNPCATTLTILDTSLETPTATNGI
jgi:hypothetical protein